VNQAAPFGANYDRWEKV